MPMVDEVVKISGEVKIYSTSPDAIRYFRPEYSAYLSPEPFPGYDYWMSIETVPRFQFGKGFRGLPEGFLRMYTASKSFGAGDTQRYIDYQPQMDFELWQDGMARGLKRHTIACKSLDLPYTPKTLPQGPRIDLEPFITVHEGYDQTQNAVPYRSTKNWNLRSWGNLTKDIRMAFPEVKIVQLGSKTARPIEGVTHDFSGRLRLDQSFNILRRSLLHIDGDSGLVHAAHALGVRSVVLFGSTPAKFFGYEENVNIEPNECGGCGWSHGDWMNVCALYESPKCLDSILNHHVFEKVKEILNGARM
jgi:Glycosyltransferase family 9 (heptosyltransferase)